jgi:hypothetical protein
MCVDSCSPPAFWFSFLGPSAVRELMPCVALETLALVTFLAYCAITRQAGRAVISLLVFVVVGVIAVAVLSAFLQQGQDYFGQFFYFEQSPGGAWLRRWGLSLMLGVGVWSGALAVLQWPRGRAETRRAPESQLHAQ